MSTSSKQARDLKHRVLTCLDKLSDRDTHATVAAELESIARSLLAESLPSFISSISATDASDKSPVRLHCLRLFSPFVDALFAEQEGNAQNGAALCLAAVIEGSGSPDVGSLRKLLPRLEKLAKCESFKAKGAILALVGSLVEVEGVLSGGGGRNAMRNLIGSLVEFLSSEDWAARKAVAELLTKMAAVERDVLSEYKASCLKTFEAKRFDKVKAARETMNQMVEAWKEIPDLTEEVSPKDVAAAAPTSSSVASVSGDKQGGEEGGRFENQEIRRALFEESYEKQNHRVVVSNETGDVCRNQRDCEDLSLIRKQFVHIENQQSNLLEILQRFTESSQRGIHSLEARVHGIELALDEISFDLAVSTGKMSTNTSSCCSLPGADFLNLTMRRKTQARAQASSQLPTSCGTPPSVGATGSVLGKNEDGCGGFLLQNRRHPLRGGRGVIVMNPLAEIPLQQVSVKGHA
ncbi:hypothetical protein SASPL_138567 [Salvia splendens]|uniref:TORTIFOLIA1/SINE1-2 N-terminal domain-containing protein n=1 Tax=Salvia splendens TaxID=180675 RepID=A0A8X8WX63_SALSN|nr:hypothetical protein SASPL_138567 [Salvia splendens]